MYILTIRVNIKAALGTWSRTGTGTCIPAYSNSTDYWRIVGSIWKSFANGRVGNDRVGKERVGKCQVQRPVYLECIWAVFWKANGWISIGPLLANASKAKIWQGGHLKMWAHLGHQLAKNSSTLDKPFCDFWLWLFVYLF